MWSFTSICGRQTKSTKASGATLSMICTLRRSIRNSGCGRSGVARTPATRSDFVTAMSASRAHENTGKALDARCPVGFSLEAVTPQSLGCLRVFEYSGWSTANNHIVAGVVYSGCCNTPEIVLAASIALSREPCRHRYAGNNIRDTGCCARMRSVDRQRRLLRRNEASPAPAYPRRLTDGLPAPQRANSRVVQLAR